MPILFPSGDGPEAIAELARRQADDFARLAAGCGPSAEDLSRAPRLELWTVARRPPAPGLLGLVSGHPGLRDGATTLTSELLALDAAAVWARTLSRFYRLGRPAGRCGVAR